MDAASLSDEALLAEIESLSRFLNQCEEQIARGEEPMPHSEMRGKMTTLNQLKIEARRRGLAL
ncbi:MAG: hypothetical protein GC154_12375 [bacterium]|nr:hypothetical protein [bacterium]